MTRRSRHRSLSVSGCRCPERRLRSPQDCRSWLPSLTRAVRGWVSCAGGGVLGARPGGGVGAVGGRGAGGAGVGLVGGGGGGGGGGRVGCECPPAVPPRARLDRWEVGLVVGAQLS